MDFCAFHCRCSRWRLNFFAPLIFTLSIIAVIYTSLVALAQSDMKKMIAYSSVAHMGFVTIGIFTMTEQGIAGAMFQMISHGLVSAALFFSVGVVYDRLHTREISAYGGVATVMPRYAVFFMFMMLASVGLPGTSGFVGEMLVLVGAWHASSWVAFLYRNRSCSWRNLYAVALSARHVWCHCSMIRSRRWSQCRCANFRFFCH
jgi:NADH:ubiquinone oxidoreductase subunit 4 (subunit M)